MPNCIHGLDERFCAACANLKGRRPTRRQNIQARALTHNPGNEVERAAVEALYAYEEALSATRGRKTRAARTWPMFEKYGIVAAFQRIVLRHEDTGGYKVLVDMGLEDLTFEQVVLRHREHFSPEAVRVSEERLAKLQAVDANA